MCNRYMYANKLRYCYLRRPGLIIGALFIFFRFTILKGKHMCIVLVHYYNDWCYHSHCKYIKFKVLTGVAAAANYNLAKIKLRKNNIKINFYYGYLFSLVFIGTAMITDKTIYIIKILNYSMRKGCL